MQTKMCFILVNVVIWHWKSFQKVFEVFLKEFVRFLVNGMCKNVYVHVSALEAF